MSRPSRATAACFVLASLASGCSGTTTAEDPEDVRSRSSAIVAGGPSGRAQDFAVMLVFSDPQRNLRSICTAALVAPRLVLTARHCVAQTELDVQCRVDGEAVVGGGVRANHDPRMLYVFTGHSRPDLDPTRWKPAGRGVEVLDDGSSNLCNHDLALVLLEAPIAGVPIAQVRLDGDVAPGEALTTIGWGVTSTALEPGMRQQRSSVKVTRVGPNSISPVLTPNELSFDESICLGDSGGPILSASTGAVLGVASRGGNGTSSNDLASGCTAAVNLATKLSPFRDLLSRGFTRASAQPRLEPATPDDSDGGGCTAGRTREVPSSCAIAAMVLAACVALARRSRAKAVATITKTNDA